jgi:rsbT co-antagonist protein RsbR
MLEVTERLLERVVASRARRVLIDLTGIEAIDAGTADHLDRLARAIGLIGGDCLFTGIGAAAAASLVEHGASGAIRSVSSLREGLRASLMGRTSR